MISLVTISACIVVNPVLNRIVDHGVVSRYRDNGERIVYSKPVSANAVALVEGGLTGRGLRIACDGKKV
jgi:hypothetical protein